MPRGVKGSRKTVPAKSVDTRIAEYDEVIKNLSAQLSEAKAKKKELLKIKSKAEVDAISKIIQKSGLTTEELKLLLEKK